MRWMAETVVIDDHKEKHVVVAGDVHHNALLSWSELCAPKRGSQSLHHWAHLPWTEFNARSLGSQTLGNRMP